MSSFTSREFRDAMGKYATGVTLVTAAIGDEGKIGITINSFSSVSLEPPLILYSLAKSYYRFEVLASAENFAINVLRADQREIAQKFAHTKGDQWARVDYRVSAQRNIILEPSLAAIECVPYDKFDGGDHVVILGRVVEVSTNSDDDPLLFFGGSYCEVRSAKE